MEVEAPSSSRSLSSTHTHTHTLSFSLCSGFHDEAYKLRRVMISEMAKAHRLGTPIPDCAYSPEEVRVWTEVLRELKQLLPR